MMLLSASADANVVFAEDTVDGDVVRAAHHKW
jgi:hypothetical protein